MKMIGTKLVLGLCIAMSSAWVSAMPIAGVSVLRSTWTSGIGPIDNIVNGSGLTSYTVGATHAAASYSNSFADISGPRGFIVFDLGEVFDVDGMAVWNFNGNNGAGFKDLTIQGSLDADTFAMIPGAPTSFAIGTSAAPELAEIFFFNTTARFIYFGVESIHGSTLPAIGFSEVMFTGNRAVGVPVPATLAPFCIGLAGLGWLQLKKA